jgi:hypothetical protein
MNKDTPIIITSAQAIGLALLNWLDILTFPTTLVVLLLGTLYMVWSLTNAK